MGRYRGGAGEIWGDIGEVQARYRRDMAEIKGPGRRRRLQRREARVVLLQDGVGGGVATIRWVGVGVGLGSGLGLGLATVSAEDERVLGR